MDHISFSISPDINFFNQDGAWLETWLVSVCLMDSGVSCYGSASISICIAVFLCCEVRGRADLVNAVANLRSELPQPQQGVSALIHWSQPPSSNGITGVATPPAEGGGSNPGGGVTSEDGEIDSRDFFNLELVEISRIRAVFIRGTI